MVLQLIYTLRDLPGLERFRIEQVSLKETVVKVLSGPKFGDLQEKRIIREFKARLGDAVVVKVEHVKDFPSDASGKFRYVVSHVEAFGSNFGALDHA